MGQVMLVFGESGFLSILLKCLEKSCFPLSWSRISKICNTTQKAVLKTITKCDCIIALSNSWKEWFEKTTHHKNVIVVKNVISPPRVKKVKHDDFVLLFLGRLGERKGIYDLLDVLIKHRSEFEGKIRFVFGGDGDVVQVNEIIKHNGLENIAVFQGWVNGEKKERLLNMADAYILPSYNEGLPISILEAMSYSLPIISTNVGGIPEILKNGENGFIMSPGDKDAMYRAILELMNNEKLRLDMGKASYSKVQEHMPGFVERQLNDLYRSLLNE